MTPAVDDLELLQRYARDRDEAAFAQVVRRYVDLVYSAAARRVGRGAMAEDVTQAVFVILATKAKSMRRRTPLSVWLLAAVRYAAANALRIEARRRRHERGAAAMRGAAASGACSANPSDVLVWQEVAAKLDDAVLKLPSADRRAVVLRYFEDRPIRDIAADLNVSEGAAKQRLSRALDKLRHRLDRQGVMLPSVGAGGLATLLAAHAVHAAPIGLANASLAAATSGAAAGAGGIIIAKGALTMMAWTKTKIAAAVVALAIVGGTGGVITVRHALAKDPQPAVAPAPKADADAEKKPEGGPILQNAPPVVVATVPQSGDAEVDPAIKEIRVTFSKRMQDGNWAFARTNKDTFPETTGKPHYEPDERTCVLPVKLEPGKAYVIWLNKAPYDSFSDPAGHKAVPYLLVFETKK